jgi:RNA recognition motif-containing protein
MEIFVGNLPGKTSVLELRRLVGQKANTHYRIFNRKNKNGRNCCLGKAVVACNNTATEIVSRLNGFVFKGYQLSVRPMFYRSELNERRKRIAYCLQWNGVNRRRAERRLTGL